MVKVAAKKRLEAALSIVPNKRYGGPLPPQKEPTMQSKPQPGRYRHYKGRDYEVIGIARHSETEQELVVYRCLYGDHSLWVRPLEMFMESVEIGGESVPRFAPLAG